MTINSQIVVGVDGSLGSKRALEWAARQALLEERSLLALDAWAPIAVGWTPYPADLIGSMTVEHEKVLQDTLGGVLGADRGVEVETRVICGSSGKELVSASNGAALLVVGRHRHRRVDGPARIGQRLLRPPRRVPSRRRAPMSVLRLRGMRYLSARRSRA
jgi:nucleotide-binding universal stress UspA family protein